MQNISQKKYTIAGTSVVNGIKTFRFANGDMDTRVSTLKHFGHTAIKLAELPKPMTKVQAIAHLTKQGTRAILPTRSADKRRKSPIQLAGEELAGKKATGRRGRPAREAPAPAVN